MPSTGSSETRSGSSERSSTRSTSAASSTATTTAAGDFRGLIEKLDYLQWLGVDCIWLLPMYQSPLRDGGYDIADFFAIHPDYGTVDDFKRVRRAGAPARHARDRRPRHEPHVVRPPVVPGVAHGPDRPAAATGTSGRTPTTAGTRRAIIFLDTEPSNWTFDPVRGQYYWHRFFHHQPDLNFDNPDVQEAMLNTLRFWLDLGIDGFRLDAVPYLYERDGTNGENLPETHEYLKQRAHRGRRALPGPRAARGGEPVARGRRRVLRRRRRVPHGVPLPGDAADVHVAAARGRDADVRDPRADARDPGQRAVGPLPAQPRRADARDGHGRGARLHVRRVREGPADEAQPRHPPPARARCSTTAGTRSS